MSGQKEHDTLCNNFTEGGLNTVVVDIKHKISALKCFWIQRLYNGNIHEWKLIPLRYIHKAFDKDFTFHSNLHIPSDLTCIFPSFYHDKITFWCYYTQLHQNCPQQSLHNNYGSIPS